MQDPSLPKFNSLGAAINAADLTNTTLDLTQCDREEVQFPAAIMPHGVLLILDVAERLIRGASENIQGLLGIAMEDTLDRPLAVLFSEDTFQHLESKLAELEPSRTPQYLGCVSLPKSWDRFEAFGHRSGDFFFLELETLENEVATHTLTERLNEVTRCMARIQAAETWQEAMNQVALTLRNLTGFDSVFGNRFLPDGTFQVMAEARGEVFPAFFDKRFPRSDIPDPGRRQMEVMPVQYAPDLEYAPVRLIMANGAPPAEGINLSLSLLRSISPICNRFYLNVGIRSRLVLSLLDHGELWGFFSCWNGTARRVDYVNRLACQLLVEGAAPVLIEKTRAEQDRRTLQAKRQVALIANTLPESGGAVAALSGLPERLLASLDIAGAALCLGPIVSSAGDTPEDAAILELRDWLDQQPELLATDSLSPLRPSAHPGAQPLAGLIAARLMESGQYLLVFRPEWVHEVRWAGDPRKPVELHLAPGGVEARLTPRGSFEEWKQAVHGRSRPWQTSEIEAMADLRTAVVLWQHGDTRRELLARLQESNAELESFAYGVSHDLQEPLRGIHHFVHFLQDSLGDRLEPREQHWLDGLSRLSQRMSAQIEALLQHSRATQQSLQPVSTDLNALVSEVRENLTARLEDKTVRMVVRGNLPTLNCDPVRVRVVFENLIANGIKYNDKAEPRIEVGASASVPPILYVKDNGIGIAPECQESIFTLFRRLHGRDEYGGGTGAGLTLARKHVERHGGRLWLESTPGEGTCFYFTLAPGTTWPPAEGSIPHVQEPSQ